VAPFLKLHSWSSEPLFAELPVGFPFSLFERMLRFAAFQVIADICLRFFAFPMLAKV